MKIRFTLVPDGPTDAALVPVIEWTLKQTGAVDLAEGKTAEFWRLRQKPANLKERLIRAVELFPCDIPFVHRDAEKEEPAVRRAEILRAFDETREKTQLPVVAVIPIRMLEAWLCFNEKAIREAAGNPNGEVLLDLPPLNQIETRPDPKSDLARALLDASELKGRRRKKFDGLKAFWRIVDFIDDFSALRNLDGFCKFEESIRTVRDNGWQPGFYG